MTDSALLPPLEEDEKILWQGGPASGFRLRPKADDVKAGALGIVVGVGLYGFASMMRSSDAPLTGAVVIKLLAVFILLVSFYMIVVQHRVLAAKQRKSAYTITNMRAIVQHFGRNPRLFEQPLLKTTVVHLSEHPLYVISIWNQNTDHNKGRDPVVLLFQHLENGQEPYMIIKDIQRGMA